MAMIWEGCGPMGKEPYVYGCTIHGRCFPLSLVDANNHTKECILLNATLLFATRGYASVSMRDLAEACGLKPASLYCHFPNKEAVWKEALHRTKELYLIYFNQLDEAIARARTFEEVIEVIFLEPKKMTNIFTCYAFSMIQAEQYRDRDAGDMFIETLLKRSLDFLDERLVRCVEKGMVEWFDTRTVARLIVDSVLIGMNVMVQRCLGRGMDYDPARVFNSLQQYILWSVKRPVADTAS